MSLQELIKCQLTGSTSKTYMHIKCINTEIISRQIDTLENFLQSQMLAISEHHHLIWTFLHLTLDESKQMLLVHTSGVMNVSINLSDIVEVSVWHLLAVCSLLVFVEEVIEVEFAFEVLESTEREALAWSIRRYFENGVQVHVVLSKRRYGYNWRVHLL